MSLNKDFAGAPLEFLRNNVIVVDEEELFSSPDFLEKRGKGRMPDPSASPETGICEWSLEKGFNNVVVLRKGRSTDKSTMTAHWLPWKSGGTSKYQLNDSAPLFFTSQMTGCRLSILRDSSDLTKATVLHIAGDHPLGGLGRGREENQVFKGGEKGAPHVRARRLSWASDSSYHDNSAFIIGYITKDGWKFYAQIVKGTTAAGLISVDKSIEIVEGHRRILEQ